jgi:perosamine synthetase
VQPSRRIAVAAPALTGRELDYVTDCIRSSWISSAGKYIERFEHAFADFCCVDHAVACCNGTAALHLALLAYGVGPGDEVIVPTLSYVATANAVRYCGAEPVFIDSECETWNLDPEQLEAAITPKTKGIVAVHLYGHPANMDRILTVARDYSLWVVEDAAEAHGALYRGKIVGSLSECAIFSFYGNKIVTTGEGGMIVTGDPDLAERLRLFRGQGQDPQRRYWFPVVGYNYRLTNVAAAIGLAQMEKIQWHVDRRREIADWYREGLSGHPFVTFSPRADWAQPAYWMSCALLDDATEAERDDVAANLADEGVETRPFFYPLHTLPPYASRWRKDSFPVAESLATRGLNLPSHASLTRADVQYVCDALDRASALDMGRQQR